MKIRFHKDFKKQYKKLHKNWQKKFDERLEIFIDDHFNPILNNHLLHGKYKEYRSINITGNLRAVYKFMNEDECIFVAIDTHSNLYT